MPISTEATYARSSLLDPVITKMVEAGISVSSSELNRVLIVAPPASGKTSAGIQLATLHGTHLLSQGFKPKILYIGSNKLAVEEVCASIASSAAGLSDWNLYGDGVRTVTGATWRSLENSDVARHDFTLVIADDAHHGVGNLAQETLTNFRSPIIGFSNSVVHHLDVAQQLRTNTNIVYRQDQSVVKNFYSDPVLTISHEDLQRLGIKVEVPIRAVYGAKGPFLLDEDPRVDALALQLRELSKVNVSSKVMVHTDSVENAKALKDALTSRMHSDSLAKSPRIILYNYELSEAQRQRALDTFGKGNALLIHCGMLDEGVTFPDLDMLVVARICRTPHVYERMIGRIAHSHQPHRLILDLAGNPTYLYERARSFVSSAPKSNPHHTDVIDECSSDYTYGQDLFQPDTELSVAPIWNHKTVLKAVATLFYHGIGTSDRLPTRDQINYAASQGLCPPEWILFDEHGQEGFFRSRDDLAKALNRHKNVYRASVYTKQQVISFIKKQWEKDPSKDGIFSQKWLQDQCEKKKLPFSYRSIVGSKVHFKNFTELANILKLQAPYFRGLNKAQALKLLKNLYKKINGKAPIAKKGFPLKISMIKQGSKERICPSEFSLFESANGNKPIFPGGLDEVNRLLGFTVVADLTPEKVVEMLQALPEEYWPDRRIPIAQKAFNKAKDAGKIPFTTRHIVGEGKMFETKRDLDIALGYTQDPSYYRSIVSASVRARDLERQLVS